MNTDFSNLQKHPENNPEAPLSNPFNTLTSKAKLGLGVIAVGGMLAGGTFVYKINHAKALPQIPAPKVLTVEEAIAKENFRNGYAIGYYLGSKDNAWELSKGLERTVADKNFARGLEQGMEAQANDPKFPQEGNIIDTQFVWPK